MKWITTIILFFGITLSLFSQITPSVYTGSGLGTNLGGLVGIGTEVRYKCISANAAIGGSYFFGYENFKLTGDHPNLGFDVGVKCYVFKGLFVGVNYGVVDKHHYQTEEKGVRKVEDVKAFSFTIGHKQNIYKGLYGMAYVGTTNMREANVVLDRYYPRFGILLGYDFNPKNKLEP